MGELALVGFFLILILLTSILWWIVAVRGIRQVFRDGAPIGLKTLPAQLIVAGSLINALTFGPFFGAVSLLLPTTIFANIIWAPSYPLSFVQAVAPIPTGFAALSFLLSLPLRATRAIALLLAVVVSAISALVVGETLSRSAMCEMARANGLSDIRRNSLLWSLANTPRDFQIEVHAVARHQSDRYAWSYSEMDWYLVPENTFARVEGRPPHICPE